MYNNPIPLSSLLTGQSVINVTRTEMDHDRSSQFSVTKERSLPRSTIRIFFALARISYVNARDREHLAAYGGCSLFKREARESY